MLAIAPDVYVRRLLGVEVSRYDLAASLYGYGARGEDFPRLRVELRRLFGLEAAR
ncbi:MAG TPA: hypothetical protein VF257_05965 [Solirubrobacteraceae bacterium]